MTLTLTPGAVVTSGNIAFTVTAIAMSAAAATGSASGTLTVLSGGVSVRLNPAAGPPGSTFQMTVTNTGQVNDTFDLALGGPAAVVAALGKSTVTLAPGDSQVVPITTLAVDFASQGTLNLVAVATSETNPAVKASATAGLSIPVTHGLRPNSSRTSRSCRFPGRRCSRSW